MASEDRPMSDFTPGPWRYSRTMRLVGAGVAAPWVCQVEDQGVDAKRFEANARLIAAAPDLLGALKAICGAVASGDVAGCLIHHSPTGWANTGDALAKAEAAIAKAEGK
jgi:hypothetical protein